MAGFGGQHEAKRCEEKKQLWWCASKTERETENRDGGASSLSSNGRPASVDSISCFVVLVVDFEAKGSSVPSEPSTVFSSLSRDVSLGTERRVRPVFPSRRSSEKTGGEEDRTFGACVLFRFFLSFFRPAASQQKQKIGFFVAHDTAAKTRVAPVPRKAVFSLLSKGRRKGKAIEKDATHVASEKANERSFPRLRGIFLVVVGPH
jgi:hypothetical protein